MARKLSRKDCDYCKERESKIQKYEEELEKEKIIACKKALEREKIANGMQCTRIDNIQLRAMQKLQMAEKKCIKKEAEEIENIWHQVLLHDVQTKEEIERKHALKLKEEMCERRKAYDEQISSANRERRETLQKEREEENKRLEKMKKKMEQDYDNALKQKQEQQITNKLNFIKGHELKVLRLRNKKDQDRDIDLNTIRIAEDDLRKEREDKIRQMKYLQQQSSIFVDHHRQERKMAAELEQESNRILFDMKIAEDIKNHERKKQEDVARKNKKEIALQEYRQHLENINKHVLEAKIGKKEQMKNVKTTANTELQRKLNSANEELRKQLQYRHCLTEQIKNNEMVLEMELKYIDNKQSPFTKKPIMFKDAMRSRVNIISDGESINPVHPFRRVIQRHEKYDQPLLPHIRN